jgi:hypothetical protein
MQLPIENGWDEAALPPRTRRAASRVERPDQLPSDQRTALALQGPNDQSYDLQASWRPSTQRLALLRGGISQELNVASRLSLQWPRINFCSTSRELCRSSCTIWHTKWCSMMVTRSLLKGCRLVRRWLTGLESNGGDHHPRTPSGLSHGARIDERRDGRRTAHAVRGPLHRSSTAHARSKPNERGQASSQGDRPQEVQQAFGFSPQPKCIQYFPTFTGDRCSVFTPPRAGRSASMINRLLQANSRYGEHARGVVSADQPVSDEHYAGSNDRKAEERDTADLIDLVDGVARSVLALHGGALRSSLICIGVDYIVGRLKLCAKAAVGTGKDAHCHRYLLPGWRDNSGTALKVTPQRISNAHRSR